jgi:hypothetical protein
VLQVGGFARETSIKVSPYGTCFRAIGPLSKCVAGGGGGEEGLAGGKPPVCQF